MFAGNSSTSKDQKLRMLFNNYSMRQRAYVEILSKREVWTARKRRKSSSRHSNSLQTSQVLNILTYALLKYELIVL